MDADRNAVLDELEDLADLEALVRVGMVEDRQAKSPMEPAPKAPPTPGLKEILAARLEELASGGGAPEREA